MDLTTLLVVGLERVSLHYDCRLGRNGRRDNKATLGSELRLGCEMNVDDYAQQRERDQTDGFKPMWSCIALTELGELLVG